MKNLPAHGILLRHFRKNPLSWNAEPRPRAAGYNSELPEKGMFKIEIKESNLLNPISVIATIAHELCHVLLLGENRISRDDHDMEPLTDLLTVFMGLGIFTANSTIQFNQWQDYQKQGWSIQSQGYLTQEAFGYALAAWAQMRNDLNPSWIKYLSTDIKAYFKMSLKLLLWEQKNRIEKPLPKANETITGGK